MKIALIVAACLFALLALAGVVGNMQFTAHGQGLPADPRARSAYLAGMWLCPATLFLIAAGCAVGAFALGSRRRRP